MASSTSTSEIPDEKTDNFYSPANFAFYKASPYRPLPLVPYNIRLLKVTRDVAHNTFRYELTNGIPLREIAGEYTAISYCAGDPKNTLEIKVGGNPFNAFANLVQAIEETCQYLSNKDGFEHEKALIWTDQICINQSDHHERAAQVSFMYEIYQSAREVTVCLTTHDYAKSLSSGKTDRALQCIKEVCRDVQGLDSLLTTTQEKNLQEQNAVWMDMKQANGRLQDHLVARIKDRDFALGWLDVVKMQEMPWFTRAWVIQEYAANQKAIFLFANQSVPDRDFAAVILSYHYHYTTPWYITQSIAHLHGINGDSTTTSKLPRRILSRVRNTLRAKSYSSEYRQALIDLLDHSRISDASDARDHVYSCLGLARRSYGIQPDYGPHVSVEDLFTSVMRVILLSNGGDIGLLERANTELGIQGGALPSWVPDWRNSVMMDEVDHIRRFHAGKASSAGGQTTSVIEFDESGRVLITKGVQLDVVDAKISSLEWQGERVRIIDISAAYRQHPEDPGSVSPLQKGDEVWVLYGATWPMLLRKAAGGYRFLGTVRVEEADGKDVGRGDWMNNAVDLERDTKTLRIL